MEVHVGSEKIRKYEIIIREDGEFSRNAKVLETVIKPFSSIFETYGVSIPW